MEQFGRVLMIMGGCYRRRSVCFMTLRAATAVPARTASAGLPLSSATISVSIFRSALRFSSALC